MFIMKKITPKIDIESYAIAMLAITVRMVSDQSCRSDLTKSTYQSKIHQLSKIVTASESLKSFSEVTK